ncbi:5'-cAMP phosphodiesterase 4 (Phosphodiesterase 4) (DdPDE4) [Durusdinium trenchii]|uniref:5'-cAMP phosphodiesterase 4 (Phosphodiesterase 4) (DdPDE4) n=1 Tax=Durusdinium trenchii TaxID=1381693 RepID=A0ABP0KEW1_9DINO
MDALHRHSLPVNALAQADVDWKRTLHQNMPAIVVVQRLENSVLPLVVQVVIEVHQLHVVMRAQQYEYVSEVIDWVHTQTQVRLPFEIYYQVTRVEYWQQVEVRAGAVLQVRSRTQRELENPVQSTGETGPSLDQYSHTTWSSLPSEPRPIAAEEEGDGTEEHTNIGGWVGSLGRSSLEADQAAFECLEKSDSREEDFCVQRSHSVESMEAVRFEEPLKDLNPNLAGKLGVGKWNFDGLEAVQQHPSILRIVGTELLQHFSFVSRSALGIFLTKLEAAYNPEVPYHSNAHAADCANSFEVMLSNSGQDPHPLRIASCYIAALGHDMGHPGVNNAFMVNSRQDLALTYNDRSVLENYHAAELERLLVSRRVLALPKALEQKERQVRIAYILSTDMSKHMQDLGDFRLKLGCKDFVPR